MSHLQTPVNILSLVQKMELSLFGRLAGIVRIFISVQNICPNTTLGWESAQC